MKYVILDSSELDAVDFSQVMEHSAPMLRYSLDGNKFLVKFNGDTPSFLNGKTQYDRSEIRNIMSHPEWTDPDAV